MKKHASWVLDSFAVLAFLNDEPGAALVEEVLTACERGETAAWMTTINLGEVVYITERDGGVESARKVAALVERLPIAIRDADRALTFAAAHVKANHRLSYADAFAVALALDLDAPVVTGDPEFHGVEALIQVTWLPQRERR